MSLQAYIAQPSDIVVYRFGDGVNDYIYNSGTLERVKNLNEITGLLPINGIVTDVFNVKPVVVAKADGSYELVYFPPNCEYAFSATGYPAECSCDVNGFAGVVIPDLANCTMGSICLSTNQVEEPNLDLIAKYTDLCSRKVSQGTQSHYTQLYQNRQSPRVDKPKTPIPLVNLAGTTPTALSPTPTSGSSASIFNSGNMRAPTQIVELNPNANMQLQNNMLQTNFDQALAQAVGQSSPQFQPGSPNTVMVKSQASPLGQLIAQTPAMQSPDSDFVFHRIAPQAQNNFASQSDTQTNVSGLSGELADKLQNQISMLQKENAGLSQKVQTLEILVSQGQFDTQELRCIMKLLIQRIYEIYDDVTYPLQPRSNGQFGRVISVTELQQMKANGQISVIKMDPMLLPLGGSTRKTSRMVCAYDKNNQLYMCVCVYDAKTDSILAPDTGKKKK